MRMPGKTERNAPVDRAHSKINVPASEFVVTGACSCAKEITIDGVVYGAEGHVSPCCVVHGWEAQTKARGAFIPSVHPDETLEILESIRNRNKMRRVTFKEV